MKREWGEMGRIDRHLTACLALYAVGIQLALSQMVLLLHTVVIMRPIVGGALPMSVFWDAYVGALPNVFYLTLPLSVAFALIFGYAHFVRERTFVALFSAGVSFWRMARPGLIVAACAAIAADSVFATVRAHDVHGAERLDDLANLIPTARCDVGIETSVSDVTGDAISCAKSCADISDDQEIQDRNDYRGR